MEYLVHVANLLYVVSYSVRDILWLRLLTVVAIATLVPYYIAKSLDVPVYWSGLFFAINGYQLYRLLLERRPVRFTREERELHRALFPSLTPRSFLKLLRVGEWVSPDPSSVLVETGEPLQHLSVITAGGVQVECKGQTVAQLGVGQFIGEMSYVTGHPPAARVTAGDGCRVLHWPSEPLRAFLRHEVDIRAALQNVIGSDLATKLRGEPLRAPA